MASWERIPYFAYGHNTNREEMLQRIPEAKLIGQADLPNYKYVLQHVSTVVPSPGNVTHGVLWVIPVAKLDRLDWAEDYHKHYKHGVIEVLFKGQLFRALTYIMMKRYHSDALPTRQYVDFVAQGYRENDIPLSQLIDALETAIAKKKGRD